MQLYLKFFSIHLKSQMQYKTSFFLSVLGQFLVSFTALLGVYFMFSRFMNIFTDGGREFGRYPFSIYGEGVLRFLTFVIPLALFQYYPLLYLLDREESVFYAVTPLLGLLFLLPGYGFSVSACVSINRQVHNRERIWRTGHTTC